MHDCLNYSKKPDKRKIHEKKCEANTLNEGKLLTNAFNVFHFFDAVYFLMCKHFDVPFFMYTSLAKQPMPFYNGLWESPGLFMLFAALAFY